MGTAAGIGPYDHSQPVAHMSSLSFSPWIKSALLVLQDERLHAGSSHGIVGLQKLGKEEKLAPNMLCSSNQAAPWSASLNLLLQPTLVLDYCCRPGRLVRFFFQSGGSCKEAQIYLPTLWGPNQQEKKQLGKKTRCPEATSLPPPGSAALLLSSACCTVPASHLGFVSWTHLHFSSLRAGN